MRHTVSTVTVRSAGRGRQRLLPSLVALLVVVSACGGSDAAPSTETPSTAAAPSTATTVAAPTSTSATTTTSTTSTTTTTTTSTISPESATTEATPADACATYVGQLGELLSATADQLQAGATITGQVVDGTLSESDAAEQLAAISKEFADLTQRLFEFGEPPVQAIPPTALLGESLELFESAFDLQAQGAAAGDQALIDQGVADIDVGAVLIGQIPDALPDCTAPQDPGTVPAEFATPEESDLTVFFRLAESLLATTESAYVGTEPEVLVEAAQASCRVLLAGGDIRSAIEAAIAASPAAGQPFGSDEQQFVLLVVTRGAVLWCPDVITDEEAFKSEVISTIVDVFFES